MFITIKYSSDQGIIYSLNVQNNLIFLRLVQSFIKESAQLAGFDKKTIEKFNLIAEEAFIYTLKTAFEENEKGTIEIKSNINPVYLTLSFLDKGLPFAEEAIGSNSIELLILKNSCDKMEWINLGKSGKEFKLTFLRPQKDIMQYKLLNESKSIHPSENFTIRKLEENEAEQVSRLIYKCYGYTYPNEDLYYPEIIKQLNKDGKLISVVAFDEINKIVAGYYALENQYGDNLSETGQAAIMPDYRRKGLLAKMREALENEAKQIRIKGIISQPVTSHTKTQKINESFGSAVCGISFGLVPKGLYFKKMNVQKLSQRETCFLYFKGLKSTQVQLPSCGQHNNFVGRIYDNIHIKYKFAELNEKDKKTIIETKYTSWGIGAINIRAFGDDFQQSFKDSFNKLRLTTKAEIIFANIELRSNKVKDLIEYIENIGFFFCGILPFGGKNNDIIRFEYLNSMINTTKIKTYGTFAKDMLDYSINQMNRVLK